MKLDIPSAVIAPSIGPAIITVFGQEIPVLAVALSWLGLVLARMISPPTLRKLSRGQHFALTILLAILVFLVVVGAFGSEPLEAGMAFAWGVGLGFSGLVAVEIFAERVKAMLRAMLGGGADPPRPPE